MDEYFEKPLTFPDRHFPKRGAYTLVISVPSETRMEIGKMGVQWFWKGYYCYTGSALGKGSLSLEGRISRHLEKNKKRRWHIDSFLADRDVEVISALITPTDERRECDLNQYLQEKMHARVPIPKFGASDCRKGCKSHLLYLGCDEGVLERIDRLYEQKVGDRLVILYFTEGKGRG